MKVILLRVGEIFLKKNNRKFFIAKLLCNLKIIISEDLLKIKQFGSVFIVYLKNDNNVHNSFLKIKKYLIGIAKISIADVIELDIEKIQKYVLFSFQYEQFKTFRISARRHYKLWKYNRIELEKILGEKVLQTHPNLKVSLKKPEIDIRIEIFEDFALVCDTTFVGNNGLPPGSSGKSLLLLSGGIDSSVAGYLLQKKGLQINFIHFYLKDENYSRYKNKLLEIKLILDKYQPAYKSKLYMVDVSLLNNEILCFDKKEYWILILKSFFYKIAEYIRKKNNMHFISTGESIGQVSSQTITNLSILNASINEGILRPLLAFNKQDIINIASKIDTYKISILNNNDLCDIYSKYKQTPNGSKKIVQNELSKDIYIDLYKTIISSKIEVVE